VSDYTRNPAYLLTLRAKTTLADWNLVLQCGKGGLHDMLDLLDAQIRQSAKLFLKSSELGLPQPLTRRRV
jgi:hypothetical protein